MFITLLLFYLVSASAYDVCIVGAGLTGATLAERHAHVLGHTVLVIERRDHIAGNCHDYFDQETGIRVSMYGVHIFHTNSEKVWRYIMQFSAWKPWEHKVVARVGDQYIPVPINIDSVNTLFNTNITTKSQMDSWLRSVQVHPPNGIPANSEEVGLQRVGKVLYNKIFKPYTIKQWNKHPRDLDASVLARIPVRNSHEDRYFTDTYQFLPADGYTALVANMLSSPNITVKLNTDYFDVRATLQCTHTYYTGPIDFYFASLNMPRLEYRSLQFERRVIRNIHYYQPRAHTNYPTLDYNYTRIIEYKHILKQKSIHTVIFYERSSDVGEPYYPVPNKRNRDLYRNYQQHALREPHVTFAGRLANYKYYNMDEAIENALGVFAAASARQPSSHRNKTLGHRR